MGHLIYRPKDKKLVHIGGFNSFGINYELKMGSSNWEALTSNHSNVSHAEGLELTNCTSVYY